MGEQELVWSPPNTYKASAVGGVERLFDGGGRLPKIGRRPGGKFGY
jgi:hypothetical protein